MGCKIFEAILGSDLRNFVMLKLRERIKEILGKYSGNIGIGLTGNLGEADSENIGIGLTGNLGEAGEIDSVNYGYGMHIFGLRNFLGSDYGNSGKADLPVKLWKWMHKNWRKGADESKILERDSRNLVEADL